MVYQTLVQDNQKVRNAEAIIKYRFEDKRRLRKALHLADVVHPDGNKDLALLGDAVIALVLIREGLQRGATREQISRLTQAKACNDYFAERGFSTGLVDCIYNKPAQGSAINNGPMATTIEAIIGAVYYDSGENIAAVEDVMKVLGISWPE